MKKFLTFLWLAVKHRNMNIQIHINHPDYGFRYFVEIDKNHFFNNMGYFWMSDEMEVRPLVIGDNVPTDL